MAIDAYFLERVEQSFQRHNVDYVLKKMMGGMIFMVNGKMCVGVDIDKKTGEDRLMARIGMEAYQEGLKKVGCREMDFTGRVMKGFVFIGPDGTDAAADLDYWVGLAVAFNQQSALN